MFCESTVDIAVIGAGHAGVEAALAAARLGCRVALLTLNLDAIANMPCNPSVGGTAKGHLVRELDALGGEMGKAADATMLQSRMLNRGKGPAVQSLRAQIDRRAYGAYMKRMLERTPNLWLRQMRVESVERDGDGYVINTALDTCLRARAVIVATGTYLRAKTFVGDATEAAGAPLRLPAGVTLRRFKTGTPARVLRSSIDFSHLELQPGDEPPLPFSFETDAPLRNTLPCHLTWTTAVTRAVILENLHRSPLYGGKIEGVGPRYCPSIEDKMVRFADKERHPVFIE
ncbi:MAG: tRNA uridine-5-carboxymethylaminomethyl(34) synthesis enzyme MnmG, partial [Oscillospiraceae bacterium]|nr:tRNA uridine-5-carboxymethylaminomethyl(34) synthesis enzyme MnmG [Oscillospiraceae bacterium]